MDDNTAALVIFIFSLFLMTAIALVLPKKSTGAPATEKDKLAAAVILVIGFNISFFIGHNANDLDYFNGNVGKVIATKFETTPERFHFKKYVRKGSDIVVGNDKYTYLYYTQKDPNLVELEHPIDFDQKEIVDYYKVMPYYIQLHKNDSNSYSKNYHDYDIIASDYGTIYGSINVTRLATISVVQYTWYMNRLPAKN